MTAHTTRPSVGIIGTGFAGLGMAVRLKAAGYDDIVLFERADDVGGTWRDNTYPGAACDVPSHLYSFSFAPKSDWTRRFAAQPEILAYLREVADRYDLRRHIRFGAEVTSADYDADRGEWVVRVADGEEFRVRALVAATGQLSRPAVPAIEGIDDFAGAMFHSATWDHDYDLDGKRVAVIGTGASAIQFVPRVAQRAARLELFQREAAHVIPKPDYAYSALAHTALRRVPGLLALSRAATYLALEPRAFAFTKFPQAMALVQRRFERYLAAQVPDAALRERLTPATKIGCKRILISNDYYQALNRPNVDVVTESITRIEPTGLRTADGVLHEVDALLLGTGFQANEFLAPMTVHGRDGLRLDDVWREGAHAHHGITVAGFPNLFILYGPNTNLGHNSIVYMLESQFGYVLQAVDRLARGARAIEVRPEVQQRSTAAVQDAISATVWNSGCTSWYTTAAGRNTNNWPGFTFDYRRRLRRFDDAEFIVTPATEPVVPAR
ncbi:flavin-containing monooxygenase [Nocardia sp. MW-W600-9]